MNILTVFFSLKGETIAPGMKIVKLEKGHTAQAAEFIQQAVVLVFVLAVKIAIFLHGCGESSESLLCLFDPDPESASQFGAKE